MKVFGITTMPPQSWGAESRQVRVIVAATSQAKAVAAMQAAGIGNMTVGHLRTYGSQSWNPVENEVALSKPGQVFWAEDNRGRKTADYHRAEDA